jgi:protein-L-isoaspartate(D-aspartate) O-methyltransferase
MKPSCAPNGSTPRGLLGILRLVSTISDGVGRAMAGLGGMRDPGRRERERMVARDVAARGIRDERVLEAMRDVPREAFVPASHALIAYDDRPLPIGEGQTISQPFIVALMLEAAAIGPADRLLDIGTGSGYAAAVASRLCAEVFSVERHAALAEEADERLRRLGYANVAVCTGDGTLGWPEAAPFDAILVAASGPAIPEPLRRQLAPGGRLVMPVGPEHDQRLLRMTRHVDGTFLTDDLGCVAFVPLIGAYGWSPREPP